MRLITIFNVLLVAIYLVGCQETATVSSTVISTPLVLQVDIFPNANEWRLLQVERADDWQNDANGYTMEFATTLPKRLLAHFTFLQYFATEGAASAYERFAPTRVFQSGATFAGDWFVPDQSGLVVNNANTYMYQCVVLATGDLSMCSYWALYAKCITYFTAQIDDSLMNMEDIVEIITNYIDVEILTVDTCGL